MPRPTQTLERVLSGKSDANIRFDTVQTHLTQQG